MPAPQTVSEYRLAIDDLDRAILTLAGRINAATYELLVLIREFDERAGWLRWGFDNCTQWLHWRCDLSLSAAREKIRVAHALKDLGHISAAFATGALSYSKVRALTRVASPANEASLCDFAMTTTAATVEERCRQLRNVQPESAAEANRLYANRSLSIWRNIGRGTMTITVELPIEQGELVARAIDKAAERHVPTGPELEGESWRAQQADALVSIARDHLNGGADAGAGSGASADNYHVLIHVDESALTRGEGRSDLPIDAVRRLTCDGSVIGLVENADGEPIRLGRKRRTVNAALRRALDARDGGCRFPGCTHKRYVHAHHIRHWADGGETNLDSLVSLCSRHHRLVHEGGYTIGTDHEGRLYFRRPDGRVIPEFGYRTDDMVDDYLDASAEGSLQDEQTYAACAEQRADESRRVSAEGSLHNERTDARGAEESRRVSAEGLLRDEHANASCPHEAADDGRRVSAEGSLRDERTYGSGAHESGSACADRSARVRRACSSRAEDSAEGRVFHTGVREPAAHYRVHDPGKPAAARDGCSRVGRRKRRPFWGTQRTIFESGLRYRRQRLKAPHFSSG